MAPSKYHYDPSTAAAGIFTAIFAVSAIVHIYQLLKNRVWYFVAFLVGVIFQVIGYAARLVNASETPNWSQFPFIVQTLFILLAPALYAASIYMILGRLIRSLNAEHLSVINTRWMTKIFVFGDVISFAAQCIGGAMLSGAKTPSAVNRGQNIILVGLGVQILFFGGFMIVISFFHYRIIRQPSTISLIAQTPYKEYLLVLYLASILIMVRSIFRVAEFAAGQTSVLQTSEVYLYCLDTALMFACAVLFNIRHPSLVLKVTRDKAISVFQMEDMQTARD